MANTPRYWSSLHGLATLTLIGAALYFLLVEHGAHTLPYLPYLVIFLCPLMHLFMHKGHGGHNHGEGKSTDQNTDNDTQEGKKNNPLSFENKADKQVNI